LLLDDTKRAEANETGVVVERDLVADVLRHILIASSLITSAVAPRP
jgi:hypothetical protein